ncbi:MAG: MaoC family dehydratase [Pararhizobium sp.]
MPEMNVRLDQEVKFSKTVGETDIYLFAGITGDFSGNHVNEEFMRKSSFGRRIAHGVLIMGFMSTTSSLMIDACISETSDVTPVSLGYDRVRFIAPVFIGDTVTVRYRIAEIDKERLRTIAEVTATNQANETVAVARHILKWVPNPQMPARAETAEHA